MRSAFLRWFALPFVESRLEEVPREEAQVPAAKEGQAEVGEPSPESPKNYQHHPGGLRGLLDALPHPGHHHQLLPDLHQRSHLHVLLLRVLSQQPHQPVLLRGLQPAVQERVQADHEGRPDHEVNQMKPFLRLIFEETFHSKRLCDQK